jgi:D-glycero-alpha-D-manno-heptose-7-phosphate kinase
MPGTKVVEQSGSVRIDLVGGTLDIPPLHLILKDAITLNLATSLKARVLCRSTDKEDVLIRSKDYGTEFRFERADFTTDKLYHGEDFGPMKFVCQILDYFQVKSHFELELESGSPAGAGLGGSSSMGVTLFNALAKWTDRKFEPVEAIQIVRDIEARILNAGMTGYQDYYPALYGGILALKPKVGGIEVDQLFQADFASQLQQRLTLIYTGKTRLSGINNWEVYKNFFDKDAKTIEGLQEIASISMKAYHAIKENDLDLLLRCMSDEGNARRQLFPNIETDEMREFFSEAMEKGEISGMKVCGAGGGGCFLVIHDRAPQ